MSTKTGSQWVWVKYSLLICLMLATAGLVRLTWWSFLQTRDWFTFLADGGKYVDLAMAVIFQYGQGPVLFLRGLFVLRLLYLDREKSRAQHDKYRLSVLENEEKTATSAIWALSVLFILFAGVDAWTNGVEMQNTLEAQVTRGHTVSTDKYILIWGIAVVAVFFEEILGVCFSLACHMFNDIREVHGKKRIAWLDAFADQAQSFISGTDNFSGNRPEPRPAYKDSATEDRTTYRPFERRDMTR